MLMTRNDEWGKRRGLFLSANHPVRSGPTPLSPPPTLLSHIPLYLQPYSPSSVSQTSPTHPIMSAASYYDQAANQEHETSHLARDQQPGPMHSSTQSSHGQEMRDGLQQQQQQQQRGFPQQGYNEQSGNGIYNGQEPRMGNSNYAQGAQQMNGNGNYAAQGAQQMQGHGAQEAVADDRDAITKCNDNLPDYKEKQSLQRSLSLMKKMLYYAVKITRLHALACY